jgi:threonine/homoserine/homoserine lactone efflux protein
MENGSMWQLFTIGFMAGLALAIPVGPMAIMLINTTVSKGFRHGAVGALGMATVDGSYALVVFAVGGLVASLLASLKLVFGLVGAVILLCLGIQTAYRNLKLLGKADGAGQASIEAGSVSKTFATFVAATVINAPTALYFLAIAPNVANMGYQVTFITAGVFALSVFLGSIVWQESLVLAGLAVRGITTNRFRAWLGLAGGTLIVALAVTIGIRALWN